MDEARSGLGCDSTDRHPFERPEGAGLTPYGAAAAVAAAAADLTNACSAETETRCYQLEMRDMVRPDSEEGSCIGRWLGKERDNRSDLDN